VCRKPPSLSLKAFLTIVIAVLGANDIKWNRIVPSEAPIAPVDPNALVGAIPESDIRLGPSAAHKERAENRQQDNVRYFHWSPPIETILPHPRIASPESGTFSLRVKFPAPVVRAPKLLNRVL
jgi:hypothetical protein